MMFKEDIIKLAFKGKNPQEVRQIFEYQLFIAQIDGKFKGVNGNK